MISGTKLDAAAVLAAARRARRRVDEAEVEALEQAIAWAAIHQVDHESSEVATWGDSPVSIAGEGAPAISEFCIAEYAAAVGQSHESGRRYLAEAVELQYRLPRLIAAVRAGSARVWRARRVAQRTLSLSADAAAHVDAAVAAHTSRISLAALDRLVEDATARFMPDYAAELAAEAAERRFVEIDHHSVSFEGTSTLRGELDLADALDLDAAISAGAEALAGAGCELGLPARRALALGQLARGEQPLALESAEEQAHTPAAPGVPSRRVVLYAHLSAAALGGPAVDGAEALVENRGPRLVTAEQVRAWCGGAQVTVRPVIDLNAPLAAPGYAPGARLREQVLLRDRACVFPWCERQARRCDLDHIDPYDPDAGDGQTTTANLAPLCRRHHRLKTFGGWTYTRVDAASVLWRSPRGRSYLRDSSGTRDLTPRPVDPPG